MTIAERIETVSTVDVDFVIVGGGAAGIAAARVLVGARRSYLLLEAANQLGGRCVTRTTGEGIAYDLGAHFLHMPELNPLYRLGAAAGFDMYPAAEDYYWLQRGKREASARDYDEFDAGWQRLEAAIYAHRTAASDIDCASLIPRDLGRWQPSIEFIVGPYLCGRDLDEVSAHDFATSDEREIDGFCREGFGALLAFLGRGLNVRLETPVRRIADGGRAMLAIETDRGPIRARAALVTASTQVLAEGTIAFAPRLPDSIAAALAGLPLGDYERIVLELEDNVLEAEADILVVPWVADRRAAALLARVGGTDIAMLDVGGRFARELTEAGPPVAFDFARTWLRDTFGGYAAEAMRPLDVTRWRRVPFVAGSFSSARPGMADARRVLRDYAEGRVRFAGEALHPSLWGTVAGAWESGEAAARQLLHEFK